MKTYEVLVECFTTVVVRAENEDDAIDIADESAKIHGVDSTISVQRELKTPYEIERAISHSDWHSYDSQKTPYED